MDKSEEDSEVENVINRTKTKLRKKRQRIVSESDNSSSSSDSDFGNRGQVLKVLAATRIHETRSRTRAKFLPLPHSISSRQTAKKLKDDHQGSSMDEDGEPVAGCSSRRYIRKILDNRELEESTQLAATEEIERLKRVEAQTKLFDTIEAEKALPENVPITIIPKMVLEFDPITKNELIVVDESLAAKLKPHQVEGVKFMYNACFESISQTETTSGSGCILAHSMGLGKTFEVVTLVHTVMANSDFTKVKKVLVVAPKNTLGNWVREFQFWTKDCRVLNDIEVTEMSKYNKNSLRIRVLGDWFHRGGVLVLGYVMFRNLVKIATNRRTKKRFYTQIMTYLLSGPDLVVCDEGHMLKNEQTSLSRAVNCLKTLRRIVLTGTPLQNNLKEYYCMVQFVKPNILGTFKEYCNRFVNPIINGQFKNSTHFDICQMKRRAHVLHKMLDGTVHRRDYGVLTPYLPKKSEFVVFIKMTDMQVMLYKFYMTNQTDIYKRENVAATMFSDFHNLSRVWTHPLVLKYRSDQYHEKLAKKPTKRAQNGYDTVCTSESDRTVSEYESYSTDISDNEERLQQMRLAFEGLKKKKPPKTQSPQDWWKDLVQEDDLYAMNLSGKIMFLFELMEMCEKVGDKLLVFTQSLYTLNLIEHFLNDVNEKARSAKKETGRWVKGLDYFRMDGRTPKKEREYDCRTFNEKNNKRGRLYLISTKAGSLGINMCAANRVVIFDVSWNPSHDIQSIFRVYRFGQTKPCFIYRLISLGTMEEKVYERQVTKLAIAKRVVDEHQIDRHYTQNELMDLYKYDEIVPISVKPTPMVPKDLIFAEILTVHEKFIYKFHEHDSLLQNKIEEQLDENERQIAWMEFQHDRKRSNRVNPKSRNRRSNPFGNVDTFLGGDSFDHMESDDDMSGSSDVDLSRVKDERTVMINKIMRKSITGQQQNEVPAAVLDPSDVYGQNIHDMLFKDIQ